MIMKNPKTHLDKATQRFQRLKVPMCFKGEVGTMNNMSIKQCLIQEPSNEENNKCTKICTHAQIDQVHKECFRGCECWIICRAHWQSMLSLILDHDLLTIHPCHGLNDLKLPSPPDSKDKIPIGKKYLLQN